MQLPPRDPALDRLDALVGEWDTEMTHPMIEGVTRGRAVFEWLTGRSFLIWRSEVPSGPIPSAIAIIGGGSTPGTWPLEYFDSRGVSRTYQTSMDDGVWRMWRDHPGFSQRGAGTLEDEGRTIRWLSELQEDGPFRPDLAVIFRRKQSAGRA